MQPQMQLSAARYSPCKPAQSYVWQQRFGFVYAGSMAAELNQNLHHACAGAIRAGGGSVQLEPGGEGRVQLPGGFPQICCRIPQVCSRNSWIWT